MTRRDAALSVRLKPDVKDALSAAAAADDRTLSQYVERLIVAHLKEIGKLPK